MAETSVTLLLHHLTELLAQLQEANFLDEVEDQVSSLHRDLILIQKFLENSEGKRNERTTETMVGNIRDVAHEVDDAIDTLILNVTKERRGVFHSVNHANMFRKVAMKIEIIKKEINDIRNDKTRHYRERNWPRLSQAAKARHKRRSELEEDDVVGFVNDSNKILMKLLSQEINPRLDVVSIIGMGGLGKTTLARKMYNNDIVKMHFDCCAWVYVSQDFRAKELLLQILRSRVSISHIDELTKKGTSVKELKEKLFESLQGKRYLVVMDNIWRTEVWDKVRSAFPDNFNGSRILITSRIKEVALHASLTPPYFLGFLNKDESWELFRKKVFQGETCSPQTETLGRQLIELCCGLPLSIVELGSRVAIMDKKHRELSMWTYAKGVYSVLSECKETLFLSYTDLPRRLKPCFLYFGVFPKDFEIPVRLLIHLWVAEGLIQHTGNKDSEDVAEEYLEELIDRSLIQVASRRTNGGVKTCRIHALFRDLCISESAKEEFLRVIRGYNHLFPHKSQRLSIQCSIDQYLLSNCSNRSRSLLFLRQDAYVFDPNHWKWVLERFKLLRVLNFGRVNLYCIPTGIENLIFLRYLAIESDALTVLPASIANLTNLLTLDMRGTFLDCLPNGIWKLQRLRNLYMSGPVSLPNDFNQDLEAMQNLRVLSTILLNPQLPCSINSKLPNVRKLGIWFASDESISEVEDIMESLIHLPHLQTLKIINYSGHPLPNSFPSTITKITLRQVCLEVGGSMLELGNLPNLQILKLSHCFLSDYLEFCEGSFSRLEVLKLENLRIKNWEHGRGSMPCLMHLVIKECIQLTALPQELLNLTTLRHVEVLGGNNELVTMLQKMQKNLGFNLATC